MIKRTFIAILAASILLLPTYAFADAKYGTGVLKIGSSGTAVTSLQQDLRSLGYFSYPSITTYFGSVTDLAVKNFQSSKGLIPDGIVGQSTSSAISTALSSKSVNHVPKGPSISSQFSVLSVGSSGIDVTQLQTNLETLGFYKYASITGYYGSITSDAVKAFQLASGITPTGTVDVYTSDVIKRSLPLSNSSTPVIIAPQQPVPTGTVIYGVGSSSSAIIQLQQTLRTLGYFAYPSNTGYYGTATKQAVASFQKAYNLSVTGNVDSTTLNLLNSKSTTKIGTPSSSGGKTIIIDPGHGGNDPGSIGIGGIHEETLTLQFAQLVQQTLQSRGYTVYMTRYSDTECNSSATSVSSELQCRVDLEKRYNADLFISLHENWYYNQNARGTATYYSSYNPFVSQSKKLALLLQKNINSVIGSSDRGINDADYYVLRKSTVPAVLIEGGFITNNYDLNRLENKSVQKSFAIALANGVDSYFRN